jgi:mannose-6-phosphate isomerase-like protein (cupin superfamily)
VNSAPTWHVPFDEFRKGLAESGATSHVGMDQGTMRLLLYRPLHEDPQTPHRRDEIYIVEGGTAEFRRDQETVPVAAGDVFFVPAGMNHRFETFSPDFSTWVVFWGPDGGENERSQ